MGDLGKLDSVRHGGLQWKRSGLNLDERGLNFHDLRGTATTKFYVAGLTSREIADILGWSPEHVEQLIERYVKRDELLQARVRKLEQSETQNRKTDSKTAG